MPGILVGRTKPLRPIRLVEFTIQRKTARNFRPSQVLLHPVKVTYIMARLLSAIK